MVPLEGLKLLKDSAQNILPEVLAELDKRVLASPKQWFSQGE